MESDTDGNPNDELMSMPEWKTLSILRHFQSSLYIFNTNFSELASALAHYCDDPMGNTLMNVNRRHRLDQYFSEILRCNHNFVAAAQSLVDHSRVLHNKIHKDKDRFPEYQQEVEKRFVTHPLTQFVIKFRQFCQHYRAPDVSAQMNWTPESFKNSIHLNRKDLLEFDGWNAPAKKFLEAEGDTIDLQSLVRRYHNHVNEFYKWFYERIDAIHEPEHRAVAAKQGQLRVKILPQMLSMIEFSIHNYETKGIGCVIR